MRRMIIIVATATQMLAANKRMLVPDEVGSCFKVHDLRRADESHYWSLWSMDCKYEVPVVYVMVEFYSGVEKLGQGVWSVRWPSGRRMLNQWTSRIDIPANATIKVHKVTTNPEEALKW